MRIKLQTSRSTVPTLSRGESDSIVISFHKLRIRAGDRVRTDDNNVGNVVLCQLSYTRSLTQ